jgi:hypothetical protein
MAVLTWFLVALLFVVLPAVLIGINYFFYMKKVKEQACYKDKPSNRELHIKKYTGNDLSNCVPYTCDEGYDMIVTEDPKDKTKNVYECKKIYRYFTTESGKCGVRKNKVDEPSKVDTITDGTDQPNTQSSDACQTICDNLENCRGYQWNTGDPKTCTIFSITTPDAGTEKKEDATYICHVKDI